MDRSTFWPTPAMDRGTFWPTPAMNRGTFWPTPAMDQGTFWLTPAMDDGTFWPTPTNTSHGYRVYIPSVSPHGNLRSCFYQSVNNMAQPFYCSELFCSTCWALNNYLGLKKKNIHEWFAYTVTCRFAADIHRKCLSQVCEEMMLLPVCSQGSDDCWCND
jgi:hypothetical protein